MMFTRFTRPRLARPTRPDAYAVPSSMLRIEVCPPSLRVPPDSPWRRMLFWLSAPTPADAAPPINRLPRVREDFLHCLDHLPEQDACARAELRRRIGLARSLRELWHLRPDVYRLVAVSHSQQEAERRLGELNRHFPTRAPRSAFTPLAS